VAREIFVTLIGFKISCKRATCFGTWNSAKKGITSHAVREILLRESGRVTEGKVKNFSLVRTILRGKFHLHHYAFEITSFVLCIVL
jgi:hypothetical protein